MIPLENNRQANPSKYESWWRGPYLVTAVTKVPMVYGFEILWYSTKAYFADITHPYILTQTTSHTLNIATRDKDKSVVLQNLEHDFSNTRNKLWLVQWFGDDATQ